MLGHLQLHQRLGHDAYTLTKGVHVGLSVGLAQQLGECHAQVLGHRLVLLIGCSTTPMGTTRWPPSSRPAGQNPTRPWTLLASLLARDKTHMRVHPHSSVHQRLVR